MKGSKRVYLILSTAFVLIFVFSCGLRIPQKAPEKVSVKYTKYLEFPITTYDLKVKDLTSQFENNMPNYLTLRKEDPIVLSFATQVEYSPATLLKEVQKQIQQELGNLSNNFNIRIDASQFLSQLSGSVTLPSFVVTELSPFLGSAAIPVDNLTLLENQGVPINIGANSITIPSSILDSLYFSEANFYTVNVYINITGVSVSNVQLAVDGRNVNLNNGAEVPVTNLLVKKSSNVQIKFNASTSGYAQISLEFRNPALNYFKDLDTSQLSNRKIEININNQIFTSSENWQMKLSGTIPTEIIANITGNISQQFTLKSGSTTIGTGSGSGKTATISIDNTKFFTLSDGITIEGVITLTGTVSADFRTQMPKIRVTPSVNVISIKDYPLAINIPLPENVQELTFSQGKIYLSFNGLSLTNVSGTFGGNSVVLEDESLALPLTNVSLPASLNVHIDADVSNSSITYSSSASNDAKISMAKLMSATAPQPIVVNQPIPDFVKDLANSATIDLQIDLNYDVSNITSAVQLTIASNFLTSGEGQHNLNGTGTISLKAENKTIDFATFQAFNMTITPTLSVPIIVENVLLKDGINLSISPKFEKFEITEVSLKNATFTQDFGTIYDFGNLFPEDFDFLSSFDFNIEALVGFDVTNSTLSPDATLTISGDKVYLTKGTRVDIGNIIKRLIKNKEQLTMSIEMDTGGGTLATDSEIIFTLESNIPLQLHAPTDVKVKDGTIDLSSLENLKDIVKVAKLKFSVFNNTTGLQARLNLGKYSNGQPIVQVDINSGDNSNTVVEIPKDKLELLARNDTPWEIIVPAGKTIGLNYNGTLNIAPFLAVDLEVATSVNLRSN
jgi:hypothetical protein